MTTLLEARAEILDFFLKDLKTPKGHFEINSHMAWLPERVQLALMAASLSGENQCFLFQQIHLSNVQ